MPETDHSIRVALADDHVLLRDALAMLIDNFEFCHVVFTASNGQEVIEKTKIFGTPDVFIMDLNMPIMDGHQTTTWLQVNYPETKVLMLTMYDTELALVRQLQAGARGFLKKDASPEELQLAIRSVIDTGYYYSQATSGKIFNLFRKTEEEEETLQKNLLSEMEIDFIRLCCSELTYKEMAKKMNLNPRSIDNLRNELFTRLNVKNRIGLAMLALRHGLVRF